MVLISCPKQCIPTCQDPRRTNCVQPKVCTPVCGCPEGTVFDETASLCVTEDKCGKYHIMKHILQCVFYRQVQFIS